MVETLDRYQQPRIVLKNEQKLHHLEEALPEAPPVTVTAAVRNAYTRRVAEQQEQQAEQELFETVKEFHACKQEEGQSVSTYVLKIKAYLDQMERIGYPMPLVLGMNLILTSLSKNYDQVYPRKLLLSQDQIQKPKSQARDKGKKRGKCKRKLSYDPKHKIPLPAKKEHLAKNTECIFTIELFSFPKSSSWIYDTGCGTHICNTIHGLRGYRKLNKEALNLYVNGNSADVEAIWSFDIIIPSGMILVLDNCHFSPSITRRVISLLRLWDNGFRHEFIDNGAISVSKDNVFYFNAIPRDGIFEIDMHNHIPNERSIYTCSNKKSKLKLDSTFLWHSRIGHINEKYIEKLQHDGLLKSIDDESFNVGVSLAILQDGKKALSLNAVKVAVDLIGII
ncbi:zinc finger, CCHC-type containing protein [Tanacetum coccineum]